MIRNHVVKLHDEESVKSVVVMLTDKATLTTRRLRDSGEMIAECTIARVGTMLYKAKELGEIAAHLPPEQICRVKTNASVLFDEATIEGCRSIPVTIGHPKSDVTIENNKDLQKGFIEGRPVPDGSFLAASIVLNDAQAIKLVDSGTDQISLGHDAELVVCNDEDADFEKVRIIPNHAAIVIRGRAQTTRIGDSGEEIEIVDRAELSVLEAERDALTAKNEALSAKLADAEAVKLTDEAIQTLVEERAQARVELMVSIAKLGDEYVSMDFAGKSSMEIKREVVAKLHDADVSGKTDEYIDARFEIALEDCSEVTLGDALNKAVLHDAETVSQSKERQPSPREVALAKRKARYEGKK